MRMLEILTAVVSCEGNAARQDSLQRHADLLRDDDIRDVKTPADLDDVCERHARFVLIRSAGVLAVAVEEP